MVILLQNIFLEKGPTTILGDCSATEFFCSNLILLFGLYSAMQHTQPIIQHIMIMSGNQVIMLYKPYLSLLREEIKSKGFSLGSRHRKPNSKGFPC
jgi:hypothetical protein